MVKDNTWISLAYDPETDRFCYSGMIGDSESFNQSLSVTQREESMAYEVLKALKLCFPKRSPKHYKRMIRNTVPKGSEDKPLTRNQLSKFNRGLDKLLKSA